MLLQSTSSSRPCWIRKISLERKQNGSSSSSSSSSSSNLKLSNDYEPRRPKMFFSRRNTASSFVPNQSKTMNLMRTLPKWSSNDFRTLHRSVSTKVMWEAKSRTPQSSLTLATVWGKHIIMFINKIRDSSLSFKWDKETPLTKKWFYWLFCF